jgi:hypothetical protein
MSLLLRRPWPRPADGQTIQINPICSAFAIMFHELLTAPIGSSRSRRW